MSYLRMAAHYDRLMQDAPYDKWVQFTNYILDLYDYDPTTIVDLGCGTGEITQRLVQAGFHLYGVDASADMLSYAQMKAAEANIEINWIQQDIRSLHGLSDVDVAVSYCDVINYLTTEEEVKQAFCSINHLLKQEGIFLFDVHSISHLENDLKNQTFAEIYDDIAYVWFCESGESEGEVLHDLTFFVLNEGHYDRFDEQHHQRSFPVDTYQTLLRETGFTVLGIYGDFSTAEGAITSETERIFFVAQKNSRC
ncbi:class I SAM-dependent methyltransferase [Aquibacillus sp. 3ASR75-11]|uniref:Class I SAM-dependent methyltransferase n=1 Tax=Terrihalobacillus insolitus TaxID=2950438 RepID=A0A9X3WU66_9BACI|nr:class I SAM-dependent methyltransferase [Terrihalobacillus insolitus]MDC3413320.1 class I SAM-dependent methyltransferase [Terrihalobacillus insolitus]MDC3424903.1 class I SAM-dependent methyltransferase [Terrihalobacillus insolitus]